MRILAKSIGQETARCDVPRRLSSQLPEALVGMARAEADLCSMGATCACFDWTAPLSAFGATHLSPPLSRFPGKLGGEGDIGRRLVFITHGVGPARWDTLRESLLILSQFAHRSHPVGV